MLLVLVSMQLLSVAYSEVYTPVFGASCDTVGHVAMVGEDINRCVKECARRPWCQYLGYRRHFALCNLYIEPYAEALTSSRMDCVVVLKSAMHSELITECNNACPVNGTSLLACNITSVEISCIKEECPSLDQVPNAKQVLGNMNTLGSRKLVTCLSGYKIEGDGEKTITCNNGHWTPTPTCIIAVSEINPESNDWKAVQVMGPPDVYPKHEQNPLAWSVSPDNVNSTEEFLEVTSLFTNVIRVNMDASLSSDFIEEDAVKLITA